jgi:hypothetical protein
MKHLKKFENFDKVAFHGFLMTPQKMRLPSCEIEWKDPSQSTGCPQFSDSINITDEDEQKAITYLNEEDIGEIIGYSRGGAILMQAIYKGAKNPDSVCMVAAAWKRQWSTVSLRGDELKGIDGFVLHGGKDDKVPLKHSVMLALSSNLPLYVFPECNHVNILKHTDDETAGILVDNRKMTDLLESLPDWGTGVGSKKEIELQYSISKEL